jgi:hypothetical protein
VLGDKRSSSSYGPQLAVKHTTILEMVREPGAIPTENADADFYLKPAGKTAYCRHIDTDQVF